MSQPVISGVAWAHRRCWGPLEASVGRHADECGIRARWSRRSLYSFGEGDLGEFAAAHDLVIFDHPFTGDIASRGLMLDLRQLLSAGDIRMLEQNRVGASYDSYQCQGGVWGLPIDAAATTAAWRPDLLAAAELAVPATLADVEELARAVRECGQWVAWAAKPTDMFCTYMAMLASVGAAVGDDGLFAPREASAFVVERLRGLRQLAHPDSCGWNPIQLLDRMSSADDIVYAPYTFNYVNYAAAAKRIRFGAAPRVQPELPARGLLGGAGIGVSAKSKNPEAAFRYALSLLEPQFQASDYVAGGGQPGMRSAWLSPQCDRMTNGFFSDCLPALDEAFLRPTIPGFVSFFHEGTHRLAAVVNDGAGHAEFWQWLTKRYGALKKRSKLAA